MGVVGEDGLDTPGVAVGPGPADVAAALHPVEHRGDGGGGEGEGPAQVAGAGGHPVVRRGADQAHGVDVRVVHPVQVGSLRDVGLGLQGELPHRVAQPAVVGA